MPNRFSHYRYFSWCLLISAYEKFRTMWILVGVIAFLVFAVIVFLVIRILWRRLYHQKIRKDSATPKHLTLGHRRKSSAQPRKPSIFGGTTSHYLKESPNLLSCHDTPSLTGFAHNKDGSTTTEETSGQPVAEEFDPNSNVQVENEIVESKAVTDLGNGIKITTSQEILTGSLGQLFFSLRYKKEKSALVVGVIKCQNLPAKDTNMTSADPYVKLQLLPDKHNKFKTRVARKTRNPVYEENFCFYGIPANQLQSVVLHFEILTFDRYSRDEIIGEVFFPLSIDITDQENTNITFEKDIQLRCLKGKSQSRGEILVSLCWQPAANRLTVVILKARNLPKMDVAGLADPYVKVYFTCKNQRIAKKKTHVKKRTLNPLFNESFVFDIPEGNDGLANISLEFLLLDWDRVTRDEVIGRLELGAKSECESAKHHWLEVCKSPRRQIADWHKFHDYDQKHY